MKAQTRKIDYNYDAQLKLRSARCNLCNNSTFVQITQTDRYDFFAPAESCRKCGLTFLNPVMSMDAYSHFYAAVYRPLISEYHGRLFDEKTIQNEQKLYALKRSQYLKPFFESFASDQKRMLDVGGSTGVVSHHFKQQFGFEPTIIDPAPLEIAEAKKFGLNTVTGFVENYDAQASYEFIALFQTIDHLLDISKSLHKIHSLLTPEGLFYVDIVDFRAAYLRNGSVNLAVKIDHPYYLTRTTLLLYLQKHGFEVLGEEFSDDRLHIGFICQKSKSAPTAIDVNLDYTYQFFEEIRQVQNPCPVR